MHRLRFAILGAVAALALGTASAVAMQQSAGGSTNSDQHGDDVATAARTTCPHGPGGVHGHCVSAVASSNSESNDQESTTEGSNAAACKAADAKEDASEKAPAKGDKAAKAADKSEDKSEHKAFAACVSGGASETPDTSDTDEASDTSDTNEK
jgi:hypothetical protein